MCGNCLVVCWKSLLAVLIVGFWTGMGVMIVVLLDRRRGPR